MGVKLPSREYGSKPSNNGMTPGSQQYDYDHYSGSNASLYIGDILIDEITSIQYRLEQQKRPIYGYASHHWDFVAKGTTIVTGNFTINFKEAGYLHIVLEHLANNSISGSPIPSAPDYDAGQVTTDPITRANIETVIQKGVTPDTYKALSDLSKLPDTKFEDVAEQFEDAIWGPDGSSAARDPLAVAESLRRPDLMDNFDIFLTFGNLDDAASNHTARRIRQVELVGQSQLVEVSGEPIQEAYTFIARDVI